MGGWAAGAARGERGATLVEYVLLVGLMAVAVIFGATQVGSVASDDAGAAGTDVAGVTITRQSAPVSFTWVCSPAGCAFEADWSTATLHYTTYDWDFGDGETGSGAVVHHSFPGRPGEPYHVSLTTGNRQTNERTTETVWCTLDPETMSYGCN